MRIRVQKQTQEVAGGRLAYSAQPPRATSVFPLRLSPAFTPQPFLLDPATGTTGALLEGLRCFPAFRPLPLSFMEKPHRDSRPPQEERNDR
jgi:hypothetical protein